jgi:parallel beta-helix repeat protein
VIGSGTVGDPYVIEDLEIDAGGSDSGIYIRDSTAYLNIVNCTAINAGSNSNDAGLRIYNCQNINISNYSFTNSSNFGILLTNSHNNTLTGNMATNTLTDAIRLYGSDENTLTGNMGTSITHSGIRIWFSDNNTLTDNTAAFNPYMGIYFSFSYYNTLTGNTAANNTGNGIYLDGSHYTTIADNTVASNLNHGIRLYHSDHNTLTNNMVTNNSVNGIRLDSSSEDNDISYNIIHTNPTGIYIDSTSSASIFENWIWDNANYDIYENGGEAKSDYADNYYAEYCPQSDSDRDGLSDGEEFTLLHTNPFKIDTDNDNFLDGYEVFYGSDPLNSSDFPMMPSVWFESITEYYEGNMTMIETIYAIATQNTAYLTALEGNLEGNVSEIRAVLDELGITIGDTDYDGLDDLDKVIYGTSLTCADTDCDNLNDAFEVKMGTDPLNDDTDGDSWLDGVESAAGTNPLDVTDYPGSDSSSKKNPIGFIIGGNGGFMAIIGTTGAVFIKRRKKMQ